MEEGSESSALDTAVKYCCSCYRGVLRSTRVDPVAETTVLFDPPASLQVVLEAGQQRARAGRRLGHVRGLEQEHMENTWYMLKGDHPAELGTASPALPFHPAYHNSSQIINTVVC